MYETLEILIFSSIIISFILAVVGLTLPYKHSKTKTFLIIIAIIGFFSVGFMASMCATIQSNAMTNLQILTKTTKTAKLTDGIIFNYRVYDYEGYKISYAVVNDILIWND